MKGISLSLSVVSSLIVSAATAAQTDVSDDMEVIVVTANKIEQSLSEVAGSIVVIDGETLQKKGQTELFDALRNEPGVSVTGSAGTPQNIVIRGMTGNKISIVRDGVPSSDGYGAADLNDQVGRNSFDLSTVKSIEIVKGASSSVYGSGALGGAVIIHTKQPEDYLAADNFYADTSLTYSGISNKLRSSTNVAFRAGDTESLLNVSGWQGDESQNFDGDLVARDIKGYSSELNITQQLSPALTLRAQAEYYQDKQRRNEGRASIQNDGVWQIGAFNEQREIREINGQVGVEYRAKTAWFDELNGTLFWRSTDTDNFTNRLMNRQDQNDLTIRRRELETQTFSDDTFGFNSDLSLSRTLGAWSHDIAYGADFTQRSFSRTDRDQVLDWRGVTNVAKEPFAPSDSYEAGVYFRDVMSVARWTLTTGLRFDARRLEPDGEDSISGYPLEAINSNELSPSLSLSYALANHLNVYTSYNHGFRAPDYNKAYGFSLHDFVPFTPFVIVPNLALKAETSDAYEIGAKYDNGRVKLYWAAYYQKFNDFIDVALIGFDQSTGLFQRQYQNIAGVSTYGSEVFGQYKFNHQWSLSAKAGYVNGKNADDEYVRAITPLEGNVSLNFDTGALESYLAINWASSMDRVPTCETDLQMTVACAATSGWVTLDSGMSYALSDSFSVSANIYNLLDRHYVRYQDVAGTAASDAHFATEPGRYVTINLRYTL
ncbi:TonB-dependent hemoglobin/transferrin/lactoferrin family receptor [Shewanella sp. A3A]|nr:TonB-dependent hemoglobin/transferrin/lactoferrin family receptor [Shewanella ferrihydritica]